MNSTEQHRPNYSFLIGLLTGTAAGAGLALLLAPRAASEIRKRVTDTAREMRLRATDGYRQATARVDDMVDDLTTRGQGVRDDVADAVVRGAQGVERLAKAAKS